MSMIKNFAAFLLALVLAISFCGCSELAEYVESELVEYIGKESSETVEPEVPEKIEEKPTAFMDEAISDEETKEKIFSAFSEINVNLKFAIKDFKKIEDETEAEKYSFVYKNNEFIVILDENSEVSSVNIAEGGAPVYLKGNDPKDINIFVITEGMIRSFNWNMGNAVAAAFGVLEYELTEDCVYLHDDLYHCVKGTVLVGEAKAKHYMEITNYFVGDGMCLYSVVADGREAYIDPVLQEGEKPETEPNFDY